MTSWLSGFLCITERHRAIFEQGCLKWLSYTCVTIVCWVCVYGEMSFLFSSYVFTKKRMILKSYTWGTVLEKPHPHLSMI